MRFAHPAWLAAGIAACLGLVLLWRLYDVRQYAALARFVAAHLRAELTPTVSIARRRLQRALTFAALASLFLALAGPQWGFRWEEISRRGNDIVFAIDTSRSMSTPDVKPDRLTRAKLAIDDFTNELDGDAVGLVAFAGSAFLVCPITLDYGAFHESLSAVDTDTIPLGGTNIASAIREAQAALQRRPGSDKILILVTDGEDLEGDALVAAKAAADRDGLKIYTIGVGTVQGELIPVPADHGGGFVKDDTGAFVRSRLDEPALKAIAAATGGLYAPLGAQGQGFDTIYRASLAPMLKHDLASRQQKIYTERYQWPLAASLTFLVLSQLIGNRRRVRSRRPAPEPKPKPRPGVGTTPDAAMWLLPAAALLALAAGDAARASPTGAAAAAYQQGDFATAAKEYAEAAKQDPKKPVLQFNSGAAAYRAGQYSAAVKAFQESISRAPSGDAKRLADQEDAYYDLGNALYRAGQETAGSSREQTLQTWGQAVTAYDTALQLRPDDADSKFNRDFVKRKIEELKKSPNPPPNPQQNPQQSNNGTPPPGQPPQGQPPQQNPQQSNNGSPSQGQPPQGQPPQGQPPQGQPPPGQQPPKQPPTANQPPPGQPQQPPPGQQSPPNQPQPPGQQPGQPPPSAGQPPPPTPGQKGSAEPPPPSAESSEQDDTARAPGQMSREEARQLLDSQKGEEKRMKVLPAAGRDPYTPPDKPVKDW